MAPVKVGCYSAFWGDSASAVKQFLQNEDPKLEYLVADYLAELTMGLLARFGAKTKKGYISEFLDLVIAPYLELILSKKVKVVTNAGGLDPVGLKNSIEQHLKKVGMPGRLKIAAVYGDNILMDRDRLQSQGSFKAFDPLSGAGTEETGFEHKGQLLSLNAYTGAEPIAEALRLGADIVVTGRCVDSALVLGPIAFEHSYNFSVNPNDLDLLASASLAGHIIECGAQATGGNFTDWRQPAYSPCGGWSNMGYPILDFNEDGTFYISKSADTGGVVTSNSVCEQMLYEVLDPENYVLPDVVVDMSQVRLQEAAPNMILVSGAKGKPPTPWLKCTAVEQKGYRISVDFLVCGDEAESKAKVLGQAVIDRTNNLAQELYASKVSPIKASDRSIILIGNESSYGLPSDLKRTERREVALRVAAKHSDKRVLDILGKETASFLTNSAPGICLMISGRAKPSPNFEATSVLVERRAVVPKVQVTRTDGIKNVPLFESGCRPVEPSRTRTQSSKGVPMPSRDTAGRLPLREIAVGRSGDKGDSANIAIIARSPKHYQTIIDQITADAMFAQFSHLIAPGGTVTRFDVPGVLAVNFVLTRSLGGGGLSSLRLDRQAKTYAQLALSSLSVDTNVRQSLPSKARL